MKLSDLKFEGNGYTKDKKFEENFLLLAKIFYLMMQILYFLKRLSNFFNLLKKIPFGIATFQQFTVDTTLLTPTHAEFDLQRMYVGL